MTPFLSPGEASHRSEERRKEMVCKEMMLRMLMLSLDYPQLFSFLQKTSSLPSFLPPEDFQSTDQKNTGVEQELYLLGSGEEMLLTPRESEV